MYFEVYGAFEIPRLNGRVDTARLAEFWNKVEAYEPGLPGAIGNYVFAVRNGPSSKPHYVGMTCNQKGFRRETFEDHKLDHYDAVLADYRGRPEMYLIALLTDSGRFSRGFTSAKEEICFVERSLIGMALHRNPELRNIRDTRYLRDCTVRGIMGERTPGRHPTGAKDLRLSLGLE